MAAVSRDLEFIDALSHLTLSPNGAPQSVALLASLNDAQRQELVSLADSNHVVIRGLDPVATSAAGMGKPEAAVWASSVIEKERGRIMNALSKLQVVCSELEAAGCPTTVMKSLDHWPDLGNDLDLYTTAGEQQVVSVMTRAFDAHIEPRSWGDRLANKWNFAIPGLPEAVEVHAQRLGQTGEHRAMARRFVTRRVQKSVEGMSFLIPAPEERVIVATLQRMYRHFYFRVCDIVNTKNQVESGTIDYRQLKESADLGGIWPGVCTYLRIVSDYVAQYRGFGLQLPPEVLDGAQFGGEKVFVRGRFIRVPIMPEGANLYTRQVTSAALRGDVPATFRLSLLPGLASAAAVAYKITGSDKGVW